MEIYGQLIATGFAHIEDRRASWLDTLKDAIGRLIALIHLAWLVVIRMLLISLPLQAALGALYWFLLRTSAHPEIGKFG